MSPLRSRAVRAAAIAAALGLAAVLALAIFLLQSFRQLSSPVLTPSSSVTRLAPTPNVLVAVRDMARLESASFHMERIIDLSEKQAHLFGLLEGEDAILLVAVADISAGVDLTKLTPQDLQADPKTGRVRIRLPAPEVFHSALDSERTYVHSRRTSTLARRQEALESRARRDAERVLVEAAREAGLLTRAAENARRIVHGLVRSLGYTDVQVMVEGSDRGEQVGTSN